MRTGLKINISWQTWYPACSSTPWQIEGVIRSLQNAGYTDLVGVHNDTVVVNTADAERNNKHRFVTDKYDVPCLYLYNQDFEWVEYEPKQPFLVLDKVYPQGVFIPKALVGMNIIHLPTVKTHVFTTITGAMKNAFGGLLHRNRHWTHAVIHDTLVDLLMIQQDIHPGIFAVMDGTFAGDGPGPRAMRWHEKDILLASADQVAIDAVSARLQGFDPMSIRFIRQAHEMGLGVGDPRQIEIVGYDIEQEAALELRPGRHLCQPRSEADLPRSAQAVRKDLCCKARWCPGLTLPAISTTTCTGTPSSGASGWKLPCKRRWGKLFESYGDGKVVMPGMEPKTVVQAGVGLAALAAAVCRLRSISCARGPESSRNRPNP